MRYSHMPLGPGVIILTILALGLAIEFFPARTGPNGTSGHAQIACANCHEMLAQVDDEGYSFGIIEQRCRSCHMIIDEKNENFRLSFHSNRARRCLDCHIFHNSAELKAAGKEFKFQYANTNLQNICGTCHGADRNLSNLSAGHREAAKLYHSDYQYLSSLSPSEACLLCHARGATVDRNMINLSDIPSFNRHQGHPLGVRVVGNAGDGGYTVRAEIDAGLQLFNGRIECQTCHSLTSSNQALTAAFNDASELCTGCHIRSRQGQ